VVTEYLIEQLQYTGAESYSNTSVKSKLSLNHPCKELIWVMQPDSNVAANVNRWSDFTDGTTPYAGDDILSSGKLQLNGHDRFDERDATYFNVVQPYQHHTRCPATGIYVYSFSLNPEQHQPSGTVNMSRIDNATLLLTLNTSTSLQLRTYATNYNVLRIMAGIRQLSLVPKSEYIYSLVKKTLYYFLCNIFKLREIPYSLNNYSCLEMNKEDHG